MIKYILIAFLAFAIPITTFPQGGTPSSPIVIVDSQGRPRAGATVTICTSTGTGTPCTPLASIFLDAGLTQPATNPTTTDGLGNLPVIYAAPGIYKYTVTGTGITPSGPFTATVAGTGGENVLSSQPNPFTAAQTFTGNVTLSNNNIMHWLNSVGTPINVIGLDNNNNVVIGDLSGNGIFFKIGGNGVGNVAAPSSGNFSGNLGWNNLTINPASFGFNPGVNSASWNASAWPFGVTDATQNSNAFSTTFQMKMNSSGTNTGNIEKGGAFLYCNDNDTSSTTPPACVGFDSLAEGPSANSNSQLWGGVARFQIDSSGDGSGKGLEIDSTNNGTNVNGHGDAGLKTKTGIWFFATGSNPSSWIIDSASGGTGWNNGIAIRNIVSGGIGIELPNNIGAYWRNQANSADIKVLNMDGSNNTILNGGASIFFQTNNGSSVGNVSSSGLWSFSSGQVQIGSGGTITSSGGGGTMAAVIANGTATMTTAAITAGNCGTTVTVAASGVLTTDSISWSFAAAPAGSNAGIVSWPTANNVNFAYCPGVAETPAAATLNWRVVR